MKALLIAVAVLLLLGACSWTRHEAAIAPAGGSAGRHRPAPADEARHEVPLTLSDSSSSVALVRHGARTLAYVADEDQGVIATVDVDARRQLAATALGATPGQLLVLGDGRVAVTLRDRNRVALFEIGEPEAPLVYRRSAPVAAEPIALARTGGRLLVASGWGRALTQLALNDLTPISRVELAREPRAVVIDEDGARAFVSHAIGGTLSVVELGGAGRVRAVDLRAGSFGIERRESTQGFALAKLRVADQERVFAPNAAVHPGSPTISHGYGSFQLRSQLPIVSVIDTHAEKTLTVQVSDGATAPSHWDHVSGHGEECILPRAVAAGESSLFLACQGTNTLLELDARGVEPLRLERRRWRVPDGPTGVAIDRNQRVVVWSQFAGELAIVDLEAAPSSAAVVRVATARATEQRYDAEQARGRSLFHRTFDPRISADGRSCASCHPDGRDDGLTWSTPEGPRQSIMLAGRVAGSEPFGWFGKHPTLEFHVTKTLGALGGAGFGKRGPADVEALIRWLEVMPAPRSAAPESTAQAAAIDRGAVMFHEPRQGCGRCHTAGETDRSQHDVKSGRPQERSMKFDTPSLSFVGGTAPYFHDGRYPTLDALLSGSDGKMGQTHALSRSDRAALIEYLESLGHPLREEGFEPAPATAAFPPGFNVPTEPTRPMPEETAPHPRSLAALERELHPRRPNLNPVAFDVRSLPLYDVPPPDRRDVRPEALPASAEAADLAVFFTGYKTREAARAHGGAGARIAVRDRGFGFIQVSLDRQPVLPVERGGAEASCNPKRVFFDGVVWETLAASGDGLTFDGASGWFSQNQCRAFVSRRVRAQAAPIISGVMYGFRTRSAGTSGETLHIISAGTDDWQADWFTRWELPLEPGRVAQRESVVSRTAMKRWKKLGIAVAPEKALIGVQLSWGVRESHAAAVAYVLPLN